MGLESIANKSWDVAIVGAGPAGATAAIRLALSGHSVLLIDKSQFPRDKVCGDGLIADSIRTLKQIGAYAEVVKHAHRVKLTTVFSPSRISFDIPGEFFTIKRYVLDRLIVERALAAGAVFLHTTIEDLRVESGESVTLTTSGFRDERGATTKAATGPSAPNGPCEPGPLSAKVVLLATGANLALSIKAGLTETRHPSAVALRCYARSPVDLDKLVISYDRSIAPGYGWVFPLGGGEFNIGCGVFYRNGEKPRVNLREVFHAFAGQFPIAKEVITYATGVSSLQGATLRCGLAESGPPDISRVIAIGETIGATFPFTGEGIGKAMETGWLAAEVVDQALIAGDIKLLSSFWPRVELELKPRFLGYEIAENWLSRPWLSDLLARRIVKSKFLQESVAGILNETVDPRSVFSLRGIVRSFLA